MRQRRIRGSRVGVLKPSQEIRAQNLDRRKHTEIIVCNLFERWGMNFRIGAIDRRFIEQMKIAAGYWDRVAPVVAMSAEKTGGVNIAFENFENVCSALPNFRASLLGTRSPQCSASL